MLFLCARNVAVTKQTSVSHLLEFNYSENRQTRKLCIMLEGAKAGWGDIKCHGGKIVILDWVTRKDFTEVVT